MMGAEVAGFPLAEQPEVFGMHDNANISFMSQEAEKVLGVVLSIQPREARGLSEPKFVEVKGRGERRKELRRRGLRAGGGSGV